MENDIVPLNEQISLKCTNMKSDSLDTNKLARLAKLVSLQYSEDAFL